MEEIRNFLESNLNEESGLFLVEFNFLKSNRLLKIFIDSVKGVTIDDCAKIARKLSAFIDENENLVPQGFKFEVSSPGIEYPLSLPFQFEKNIGRNVSLKFKEDDELQIITNLKLTDFKNGKAFFQTKKKEFVLGLEEIVEAKVIVEF
ncbi:MAG: hypothetical protein DWQ06_15345 [Calditrichaeota bacterium]|nr:MAG: hypothetical protein DWQ06_15345 [Calditrichota bacterium]